MTPALRRITAADQAWLARAFTRYLAEVAPGATLGPLSHWWEDAARDALMIAAPGPAGFALVRRAEHTDWDFSEFYILPTARRRGLGQWAVQHVLSARPGTWQLGVVTAGHARAFWAATLAAMPGLIGLSQHPPLSPVQIHSYRFTITGPSPMTPSPMTQSP